jgi:glycosyltransferase involved in cell wall biosynthesis
MKIVLIGNYKIDGQESMQRFAALMERGLTRAGHEVRRVAPRSVVGQIRPSSHGFGKWLGYIDKFAVFPSDLMAALSWADVAHICDQSNSFYTRYMKSIPHVVTCHDLLAVRSALGEIPQNRPGWSGRQLQRIILNGLKKAQHIVCVSEATRRDSLRIIDIPGERLSRVYNSLNYSYSRMERREAESRVRKFIVDPGQSFVLHVGGNHWYKNRLGVLHIFSLLRKLGAERDLKLVLVGQPGTDEMRQFVLKHAMSEAIVELTGVGNEDLRALYSMAKVMLFPSLQEGFGWPIIEAQACGCPVLTSRRAPMDEVGGDAAIYVDPENPESAAIILKRVLEGALGKRESSLLNVARFTESVMIDGYLSVYEKVQREYCASQAQLVATAIQQVRPLP